MDEVQKQQIIEMRLAGAGYKDIGITLNLSRDAVRRFCKRHNMWGYGKLVALNFKEQTKLGHICFACGRNIESHGRGRPKRFCSEACRREWWIKHKDLVRRKAYYTKTCVYCGKKFTVYGDSHRRYCSRNCYIHDRFWRKEEGREPYVSPAKEEKIDEKRKTGGGFEDAVRGGAKTGGLQSQKGFEARG